ncbi:hypothetical protein F8388_026798 [Cannabis sativa]|uniref:Uncharacterized protein n=1 Tax=Cannabis sativa TaxID=3483 RepID=A0A7J6H3S1_CANSA|nr:hypothetical protein F8388_026798 [Cannabis sativa]
MEGKNTIRKEKRLRLRVAELDRGGWSCFSSLLQDVIDMDGYQNGEVLYIPGAMTPTEILSAHDSCAKIVKVYPVSVLGGVQYISALKKPFPDISMVASQGITIDSMGEYIANGASSVVLSDAIFDKEAMAQNNFNVIRQLAHFATLQASQKKSQVGRKQMVKRFSACLANLTVSWDNETILLEFNSHLDNFFTKVEPLSLSSERGILTRIFGVCFPYVEALGLERMLCSF